MERALSLIVRWAQENHTVLTEAQRGPTVNESIPVRARYRRASGPCALSFADARSGQIRVFRDVVHRVAG